ncbi:MAG: hypothetical protein KDA44_13470 [Planctomycetales bacterium]|nr:hypothetical protein [Planctomycetales bacterium]
MLIRKFCLALAATCLVAATSHSASAQCGAYGYGAGYWDIGNLYRVLSDRVPYYAAFPPVYYSVPVPRTYGHSPFAYLPSHETPEVEVLAPLAIDNPFFRADGETQLAPAADAPDKLTETVVPTGPVVIHNPFYRSAAPGGPVLQAASLQR